MNTADLITVEHATGYLSFTPEWLATAPVTNVKAMLKLLRENEYRSGNNQAVRRIAEAMPTLGSYARTAGDHKRVKAVQAAWSKLNGLDVLENTTLPYGSTGSTGWTGWSPDAA